VAEAVVGQVAADGRRGLLGASARLGVIVLPPGPT
jgi:hypothetical protein